jgi:flagellar biosynthesis protein FlhB
VLGLYALGMQVFGAMRVTMHTLLSGSHSANLTRVDDLVALGAYAMRMMAQMVLPVSLIVLAAGVVGCLGQVGFLLTGKPLVPSMGKLNPLKGIQQMFSARSVVRLALSLLKLIVLGAVAAAVMYTELDQMLHITELSSGPAFALATALVFRLALVLAVLLLVLAAIDWWYQRFQHGKDLRMTKEQIKQEMKNMDGDPLLKQRRARVARQLAMARMSQAVPKADVVITNPTHYAVALKYDRATMQAPKVVAKGADFMALRIRQIAVANGVPLVERKPLARALYADLDVGQEVPPEHYAAVAEILAYVYRISGQKAA